VLGRQSSRIFQGTSRGHDGSMTAGHQRHSACSEVGQPLALALKGSGIVAKGTFSVCCMMRESPDVVRRFCQYYRQIGAENVWMFWDGNPRGEERHALENAARAGGSSLVFCDDDFWRGLGVDGPILRFEELQSHVYRFGYEQCKSDWMFFCDADEFLVSPVPVPDVLKAIPEDVESLRIRNFEAVWGPDDDISEAFASSYFRVPLPRVPLLSRALSWIVFGKYVRLTRRGLVGHSQGKHFLRTGIKDLTIQSHVSLCNGKSLGVWAHSLDAVPEGIFVAHFDAISFERWCEKWRRRISQERLNEKMGKPRQKQMDLVADAFEKNAAEELFRRLYLLSKSKYRVLSALGAVRKQDIFDHHPE
jgi:hypothetical protein